MIYKVAFVLFFVACLAGADEGDKCVKGGSPGTCLNIKNCPAAIEDLKKRITPQICSFIGTDPVVCCVSSTAPPPTPAPTPAPPKPTPVPPPVTGPPSTDLPIFRDECEPLSEKLTSKKTGQKAWDKCVEYQQALVYPCKRAASILGGKARQYLCHHNADDLIVGGDDAALNEFTHMVLLGYGTNEAQANWKCGGSLISEQWVLTAGHCTYNRNYGEVTFARPGLLKRSEATTGVRRVARYLTAPGYEHANRYNDIALVMMDQPVTLSQFLVPACLHVGDAVDEERVLATGWGLTLHRGNESDVLQKVILNKFRNDECSEFFPAGDRHMLWGVDDDTQVCYGDKKKSKDTCQGDSGGPIMIKSKKIHCMYVVTGVTSFGGRCGRVGTPAIYTHVAHFLSWLEKTVWP